jgi:uncharacterized membrane protein
MASSAAVASVPASLDIQQITIGRTFERAWLVVCRNPVLTITLSLLLGATPVVVFDFLLQRIDRSALMLTVAGYSLPGVVAMFFLQLFMGLLVGVLMQGAMIVPVRSEDQNTRASYAAVAATLLRFLGPLIILGALTAIAVEVAVTLLIIPAVLIYLLWSVAPSALVDEGEGIFMALSRSQELTRGARWKIFMLLLVMELINVVLAVGGLILAVRMFGISTRLQESVGYAVFLIVLNTVSCLMWATVQASLYVDLTKRNSGGSVETLEQVFA